MKKDGKIIRIFGLDIEKFTESQRLAICITRREHKNFLESLKTLTRLEGNTKNTKMKRRTSEIEFISLHIDDFITRRIDIHREKRRNEGNEGREGDLFVISLYKEMASKAQEILKP